MNSHSTRARLMDLMNNALRTHAVVTAVNGAGVDATNIVRSEWLDRAMRLEDAIIYLGKRIQRNSQDAAEYLWVQ